MAPRVAPQGPPVAGLVALLLTGALAYASVSLSGRGSFISVWWPAAGTAVIAVLAVAPRHRAAAVAGIALATGAANHLGGRPLELSVVYGLVNAVEALVVVTVLAWRRPRPELVTQRDVLRLVLAAAAGAVTTGLVGTAAAALLAGSPFFPTVLSLAASRGSALLTIVPIFLAARHGRPAAAAWQRVLQPLALVVVVAVVFEPGSMVPLTFLPMPVLVWGAFVLPTRWVAAELLALAAVVTTVSSVGIGPFGAADVGTIARVSLVQGFVATYSASVLLVSAACTERRRLAESLQETEQLIRGGLLDAQVGLVILRRAGSGPAEVVHSNARAVELLAGAVPRVDRWGASDPVRLDLPDPGSPLAVALAQLDGADSWRGEAAIDGGRRRVDVLVHRARRPSGESVMTVQVVDVTERHRTARALEQALAAERRAADELRAVDRQKDDFVSSVSHELRTPITSIRGFTEVLDDEGGLTPDQLEYVQVIDRNARRLGDLVEDLLTLGARPSRPKEVGPVDLRGVCADTLAELTPVAQARRVELVVRAPDPVVVRAHRGDVVRVLTNLVTNGLKFTPAGGTVTITVDARDGRGRLVVADTGMGIAPDELDRVFDRFYRTARADGDAIPGTGLGLALVRDLVDANGGAIDLRSDGASGTTATVVLPLAVGAPAAV